MKALIQRVKKASVIIDNKLYSEIKAGVLVFLGVSKSDTSENIQKLARKIITLRIFEDEQGKMSKSVQEANGEILVVSQFTLLGNCKKGTRPSFDEAASPHTAKKLYDEFVKIISDFGVNVKTGKFQAMMDVALINDGPVTFLIEK